MIFLSKFKLLALKGVLLLNKYLIPINESTPEHRPSGLSNRRGVKGVFSILYFARFLKIIFVIIESLNVYHRYNFFDPYNNRPGEKFFFKNAIKVNFRWVWWGFNGENFKKILDSQKNFKSPEWSSKGDLIKILQKLSFWNHFEAKYIEFLIIILKSNEILADFFSKKMDHIKQHKLQNSENSILKIQWNNNCWGPIN